MDDLQKRRGGKGNASKVSSKSCCSNFLEQRVGARKKNSSHLKKLPNWRWVHKHEKLHEKLSTPLVTLAWLC
jgi:hypothetical protein